MQSAIQITLSAIRELLVGGRVRFCPNSTYDDALREWSVPADLAGRRAADEGLVGFAALAVIVGEVVTIDTAAATPSSVMVVAYAVICVIAAASWVVRWWRCDVLKAGAFVPLGTYIVHCFLRLDAVEAVRRCAEQVGGNDGR